MTRPATAIPLVDLAYQHRVVSHDLESAILATLESGAYIGGAAVEEFERAFAEYCGVRSCVGVANGTDAIELALRVLGVGPGDRVIVPANTFVATAEAVCRTGAVPIFVDCDRDFLLMDPERLRDNVRRHKPRAIVPVHLYGQLAPMSEILDVATSHNCAVVEDAAQAQGAKQGAVGIGGWGSLAATSFYPGKNLGAAGDAGAVLTNVPELAAAVRLLANHGSKERYRHEVIGMNSRLDAIQSNVLSAKLQHLDSWNAMRARAAAFYDDAFRNIDRITTPLVAPTNTHVWHLYVIQLAHRDRVLSALHAAGIGAAVHYPIPVHLQPAFKAFGGKPGDHPNAEAAAQRILSLPLFPGLTEDQQTLVVDEVQRALG